jgi:hypothetical protein
VAWVHARTIPTERPPIVLYRCLFNDAVSVETVGGWNRSTWRKLFEFQFVNHKPHTIRTVVEPEKVGWRQFWRKMDLLVYYTGISNLTSRYTTFSSK